MTGQQRKRSKCLILFRHAKSEWPEGADDHDRPLSDRGRKAAPLMGGYLEEHKLLPDLALLSTARRVQETWTEASKAIRTAVPQRDVSGIYEAESDDLLAIIRDVEGEIRTLLIVGHNPGLEILATRLMRDAGGEAGERLRNKFPTAAIAVLRFGIGDWKDITMYTGSLDTFVTPKSILETI